MLFDNAVFKIVNRVMLMLMLLVPATVCSENFEINDVHIHYNDDVWERLSAKQAVGILRDSNVRRAGLSSTPVEGTDRLYREAPDLIIPFIRPYRILRDRFTWHSDPSIIDYLKKHLKKGHYQGFGEFHLFKKHKDTQVVKDIMQLVADHKLVVNAHTDGETIEYLLQLQPGLDIIWAHCGMDHPVDDVRRLLSSYSNLYCDLSYRHDIAAPDEWVLYPEWKALLEKFDDRFMVAVDTHIPRVWARYPDIADYNRTWLVQLNETSRQKIATGNVDKLFPLK